MALGEILREVGKPSMRAVGGFARRGGVLLPAAAAGIDRKRWSRGARPNAAGPASHLRFNPLGWRYTTEVDAVCAAPWFHERVRELAAQLGREDTAVLEEATGYLREISATHEEFVMESWNRFGRWMLRGYDIISDDEQLARLRALDRKHSLIFLISHRSYLDFWTVPVVLRGAGIAPFFGFSGANMMFFPLGTVTRLTGYMRLRRTTVDSPVYRLALRSLEGQLVASRANLVWSIEGGRTRTGKLRPPRYGLVRYLADAVESVEGPEAMIVPMSIVYDQLPPREVAITTSEALGQRKRPENMRWLLGLAWRSRQRLGRAFLDVGEPFGLRQRLAELRAEDQEAKYAVERVALEVSHRINRAAPVTPTAAVCVALLAADRSLTLDGVLDTVRPLADYFRRRGWRVAGAADLTDRSTVRRTLQELVASGVLTSYADGAEAVWGIGPRQHLVAAFYRNSAIHALILRAITELALLAVARRPDGSAVTAWDEALRLRELLKFDFFFPRRRELGDELRTELALFDPEATAPGEQVTQADAQNWLEGARFRVAHLVLRPYLDAYLLVADRLLVGGPDADFDDDAFVDECLRVGRQWVLERRMANEESLSTEMFRTALKLARHRDLCATADPTLPERRAAFVRELDGVRQSVAIIANMTR
jgi:glycerol-3-phosphate O-acyltransferase